MNMAPQEKFTECTGCEIHCWAVPGAKCCCGGIRVLWQIAGTVSDLSVTKEPVCGVAPPKVRVVQQDVILTAHDYATLRHLREWFEAGDPIQLPAGLSARACLLMLRAVEAELTLRVEVKKHAEGKV